MTRAIQLLMRRIGLVPSLMPSIEWPWTVHCLSSPERGRAVYCTDRRVCGYLYSSRDRSTAARFPQILINRTKRKPEHGFRNTRLKFDTHLGHKCRISHTPFLIKVRQSRLRHKSWRTRESGGEFRVIADVPTSWLDDRVSE